eukprot:6390804-Pyramimonas_sp.AAC.1
MTTTATYGGNAINWTERSYAASSSVWHRCHCQRCHFHQQSAISTTISVMTVIIDTGMFPTFVAPLFWHVPYVKMSRQMTCFRA